MNYFELYPGDYQRDTNDLSLAEHGAYFQLLSFYYSAEEPLPAAMAGLYRICRAMNSKEQMAVKTVANRYFHVGDDGLRHNDRVDAEILKARKRIEAAKANGSKGGRPTKQNPAGNPTANPAGNPAETQQATQRGTHPGEALHTPHATRHAEAKASLPRRVDPPPAEPVPPEPARAPNVLPDGVDGAAWDAFEGHHRERGRWSAVRRALALGQLRSLIKTGQDPNLILTWATTRGLADLADCARRITADAAKELPREANRPSSAIERAEAEIARRRAQRHEDQRSVVPTSSR